MLVKFMYLLVTIDVKCCQLVAIRKCKSFTGEDRLDAQSLTDALQNANKHILANDLTKSVVKLSFNQSLMQIGHWKYFAFPPQIPDGIINWGLRLRASLSGRVSS